MNHSVPQLSEIADHIEAHPGRVKLINGPATGLPKLVFRGPRYFIEWEMINSCDSVLYFHLGTKMSIYRISDCIAYACNSPDGSFVALSPKVATQATVAIMFIAHECEKALTPVDSTGVFLFHIGE